MDTRLIDKIVNAVLYEGYILYPYRPAVKNRQRWTFGGVFPESYSVANHGAEPCAAQTQVLIEGGADAILSVRIRFLHLTDRIIGAIDPPLDRWPNCGEPSFNAVEAVRVASKQYQSWQEAAEREVTVPGIKLMDLLKQPTVQDFEFPGGREAQPLAEADGKVVGVLVRLRQSIRGQVELSAQELPAGLFKLTCRVANRTAMGNPQASDRRRAQMYSMASTHVILNLQGAEFISAIDPPEPWKTFASQCHNSGCFPVLVGTAPQRDTVLCSPIILYDYPQIAPESPGDLFDGGEIDEILTLRILTLSDEEKQAVANVDERARAMLERTHTLESADLALMHGVMRNVAPVHEGGGR
jgi:hydrogenase maturation protease